MTPRLLPAGDRAVLLETGDLAGTLAVAAQLRRANLAGVEDLIPAAETVLIRLAAGIDLKDLGHRVLEVASGAPAAADEDAGHPLIVPVRYDGPDLADVATATGLTVPEVIRAHTETLWRAAFVGFAPGFAYLSGGDARLAVPRRVESRPSVPTGSVAVAGEFSAIYPRQSPGGWQLIGSTETTLWDIDAKPPAAIQPGTWIRFVDVDAEEASASASANLVALEAGS